jgi:hypothetical protein
VLWACSAESIDCNAVASQYFEIALSVVKLVYKGVVREREEEYGFGGQSRCPYLGDRWDKGKEDMGTGTAHRTSLCSNVLNLYDNWTSVAAEARHCYVDSSYD